MRRYDGPFSAPSRIRSIATNALPALANTSGAKIRLPGRVPCKRKVTNRGCPTTSQCGRRLKYCLTQWWCLKDIRALKNIRGQAAQKAACSQDWLPHFVTLDSLPLRRHGLLPRLPRGLRGSPPPQPQVLEIFAADHVIPIREAVVQLAGRPLAGARVASIRTGFGGVKVHHYKNIAVVRRRARFSIASGNVAEAQRVHQAVAGLHRHIAFA